MLKRLKSILAEFFRQADLVLLGLCCVATLFGIVLCLLYYRRTSREMRSLR